MLNSTLKTRKYLYLTNRRASSIAPPLTNCTFCRSEPWSYTDKFGYIHTRLTAGCWGSFETEIAQQAFDALEPGGWFEAQETEAVFGCDDGTLDPNGPMCTWFHEMRMASEKLNRPAILGSNLKEIFERVGFVDVEQLVFRMPLNAWPRDERLKDLGWMWGQNFSQGLNGFSIQLLNRAYGRSQHEIEVSSRLEYSRFIVFTLLTLLLAITRQSPGRTSQPACTRLYAHFRGIWKKAIRWRDSRVKTATKYSYKKRKKKK